MIIKHDMQMVKEQQIIYVSPQVKTVEIKNQQMLCQSGGAYNDPFGGDTPENI